MRREEHPDRVIDHKAAAHPPARGEGIQQEPSLEDADQGRAYLTLLEALPAVALDPDFGLLDEAAHKDNPKCGEDADPQHAAPSYCIIEQPVDRARQQKAETP